MLIKKTKAMPSRASAAATARAAFWDGREMSFFDPATGSVGPAALEGKGAALRAVFSDHASHLQLCGAPEGATSHAREESLRFQLDDCPIEMDDCEVAFCKADGLHTYDGLMRAASRPALGALARSSFSKRVESAQAWLDALARGAKLLAGPNDGSTYAILTPCGKRMHLFVFQGEALQLAWPFDFGRGRLAESAQDLSSFLLSYESRLSGSTLSSLRVLHGWGDAESAKELCAKISAERGDLAALAIAISVPGENAAHAICAAGAEQGPPSIDFWPRRPASMADSFKAVAIAACAAALVLGGSGAFKSWAKADEASAKTEYGAAKAKADAAAKLPGAKARLDQERAAWLSTQGSRSSGAGGRAAPAMEALGHFSSPDARLDRFQVRWVGSQAFIRAEGSASSQEAAAAAGQAAAKLGAVGSGGAFSTGWESRRWTFSFSEPLPIAAVAPGAPPGKTLLSPDGVLAQPSVPGSTYQPPTVFSTSTPGAKP